MIFYGENRKMAESFSVTLLLICLLMIIYWWLENVFLSFCQFWHQMQDMGLITLICHLFFFFAKQGPCFVIHKISCDCAWRIENWYVCLSPSAVGRERWASLEISQPAHLGRPWGLLFRARQREAPRMGASPPSLQGPALGGTWTCTHLHRQQAGGRPLGRTAGWHWIS